MKTKITKYTKYRTLYLPKEIVDCLFLNVYSGMCEFDFNIEIGLNILNDIHTKDSIFNRDDNYNTIFSPLYSLLLKEKYGDIYVKHKNFMVNQSIIWNDSSYIGKATNFYLYNIKQYISINNKIQTLKQLSLNNIITTYSFRFNTIISILTTENKGIEENTKSRISNDWYQIKIPITKKNKKFLTSDYVNDSKFINNTVNYIKKMGSLYRKHFKIDFDNAFNFIVTKYNTELNAAMNEDEEQAAYYRYSSRLSSILLINNGKNNKSLRFNRNSTNKRLDTNLTNMASDIRPFIVGYENMSYLDLNNSQPVLFNIILKSHYTKANNRLKNEMDLYFKLTISGQWYEYLQHIYKLTRAECKEIWMKIAYSKNTSYQQEKHKFKKEFPEINLIIEDYKRKNYADFAITLQKLESKIFIDEICKELVKIDIIPFTLHDGLLVPKEKKQETLQLMQNILSKHLGAIPQISIE